MNKRAKRIIGIFIGLLLWGFFFIQNEFAFYGIYSLISYNVHELSSLIPMVCILATAIWMIVIIKKMFQKKACVGDKCFAVLLVILLLLQIGGFHAQGQDCAVTNSKEYFATYICDRNNPNKGKLARLVLIQDE